MTVGREKPQLRVYKYPLLLVAGPQDIEMAAGAKIVEVFAQDDRPCLWAEINTTARAVTRRFFVYATGENVQPFAENRYVGTVHVGWTVWHVYEQRETSWDAGP